MPEFTWKAAGVRLKYGLAFWLKHGGPLGLLKWVVRDLSYYCWLYLTRSGWRERRFDSIFGVQTRQIVPLSQLTVSSPNVVHGIQHAPTRPRVLRSLLGRLDIDYRQFVFIDLGCGKGRAVLVAAEFPFKKIIGIEFAAELVRAARENVSQYRNPHANCREIVLLHMDASDYQIPNEKTLIYLFNPFGEHVMKKVLTGIRLSLQARPREMYLVYFIPMQARMIDELLEFEKIYSAADRCIYRYRLRQKNEKYRSERGLTRSGKGPPERSLATETTNTRE